MKLTIKLIPATIAAIALSSCNENTEAENSTDQEEKKAPEAEVVAKPEPKEVAEPVAKEDGSAKAKTPAMDMAKMMAAEYLKSKGGENAEMLGALLENADGLKGLQEQAKEMGFDINSLLGQANNLTDEQKEQFNSARTEIFKQFSQMSKEDRSNMLKQGKELMEAFQKNAQSNKEETKEEE